MDPSSGSVFSQTLLSITNTKLEELSKKRATFDTQHSSLLAAVKREEDALDRLALLVEGVKSCFLAKTTPKTGRVISGSTNNAKLEIDLKNLDRFLGQARHDPSVSSKMLQDWEETLLRHLEVQSLKFQYATLYGRLVNEWLSSEKKTGDTANDDIEMSDTFEEVPSGKKLESRAAWERSVFEPYLVIEEALDEYLEHLFGEDDPELTGVCNATKSLRKSVEWFEATLAIPGQFNHTTLSWTIQGLLASDLLTDEKRSVLRDFIGKPVILSEIADVLNMRMAAPESWTWGGEVLVEQRRKLNGTYNIHLHEDLLQAMFLQFIGVKWSVFFKGAFRKFRRFGDAWKSLRKDVPKIDQKRRDYYLGAQQRKPTLQSKRRSLWRKSYFLSQLPDSEYQQVVVDEGDEEAEIEEDDGDYVPTRTMQTARKSTGGKAPRRSVKMVTGNMMGRDRPRAQDEDSETDDDADHDTESVKKPMEAKHGLLHLLSTEIAINTRIHGEITCFRSCFDQWNPLLPHTTILTVLKFFGISGKWLVFFKKFLEAPLKFIDEASAPPRIRRRGTPGSHALSDVFGEVVLFCLDFSINQNTDGALLYRMQDDFWFWSPDHAKCVKAWKTIIDFTNVMGVSLNKPRTGTVRIGRNNNVLKIDKSLPQGQIRWGFLYLDSHSGRFEIDQTMIDSHIEELRGQLQGKMKSIFTWIQAWNTYAATFFSTNFGKPANCFGRDHVDTMLATHERIHRTIFATIDDSGSSSVVEYLKKSLRQRFGVEDVPDGFLFFPVELGGLDLQSPFVGLLQIRDAVIENPSNLLDKFEEAEREAYRNAKLCFERGDTREYRYTLDDPDWEPETGKNTFMPFDEYIRYREDFNYGYHNQLTDIFDNLLRRPSQESIDASATVTNGLDALSKQHGLKGILPNWHDMEPYWKWVAQMYGPEMMERFGGFNVVDPGLLPIGMLSLFRGNRVNWQG
ncbi:hypothetical protein K432DRAFT_339211 [Lepidopterella palustris CBS 459.81]|uniref:Reverse transcriptase domain-containing protein n=1 Tax=Lepidopterella palustris CBS 459.81 TaxID=1314670 RepID=A0A8E2DZ51_9PEZI|nr:hypothetical protein K432DRAFT_339211 [Lepidopterella palustris CBS 459.81]